MSNVAMLIFPTRGTLIDAVDTLQTLDYVTITNTALIAKAEDGETQIFEDDISAAEGSIAGGTLGSLMTALGMAQLGAFLLPGVGPILALGAGALIGALVGGAAGGLTAGLLDFGFKNDQLDRLAQALGAGRIALVIELADRDAVLPRLRDDLKDYDLDIVLPPEES